MWLSLDLESSFGCRVHLLLSVFLCTMADGQMYVLHWCLSLYTLLYVCIASWMSKYKYHTTFCWCMCSGLLQGVPSALPLLGWEKEILLQCAHGEALSATPSKTEANHRYVCALACVCVYSGTSLLQIPISYGRKILVVCANNRNSSIHNLLNVLTADINLFLPD